MRRILIMAAALLVSLSCVRSNAADKVKSGDSLPDFVLKSDVYGDLSSMELRGKVVYLCFFATWCPPCQHELAAVQNKMLPEFGNDEDFIVIAVGREHTDAQLSEYNKSRNFDFPLYPDPDRTVYSLFAEETIPRAYVVDRDGVIVDASTGYDEEHFSTVLKTIRELLDSGSSVEID